MFWDMPTGDLAAGQVAESQRGNAKRPSGRKAVPGPSSVTGSQKPEMLVHRAEEARLFVARECCILSLSRVAGAPPVDTTQPVESRRHLLMVVCRLSIPAQGQRIELPGYLDKRRTLNRM